MLSHFFPARAHAELTTVGTRQNANFATNTDLLRGLPVPSAALPPEDDES